MVGTSAQRGGSLLEGGCPVHDISLFFTSSWSGFPSGAAAHPNCRTGPGEGCYSRHTAAALQNCRRRAEAGTGMRRRAGLGQRIHCSSAAAGDCDGRQNRLSVSQTVRVLTRDKKRETSR